MARGIAIVVGLLMCYVGSYATLLNPGIFCNGDGGCRYVRFRGFEQRPEFLMLAYKPLLILDQKLRPEYWNWEEEDRLLGTTN